MVTGDLGIVTGSRDKTIRIWKEAEDGQFADDTVLVQSYQPHIAILMILSASKV